MTFAERVAAIEQRLYARDLDRDLPTDLFLLGDDAWTSDEGRTALLALVDRLRVAEALQLPPDVGTDTSDGPMLCRPGKTSQVLCLIAMMIPYRDVYPEWRGWRALTNRVYTALAAHAGEATASEVMIGLL